MYGKYTDPSGEIIGTIITFLWDLGTTIFVKGGIDPWNTKANRQQAWRDFDPTAPWSKTNKAWRIDKGLFQTNPNRTFLGRTWELVSRFTWQLPQTIVGNAMGHGSNLIGKVNDVTYFDGITVINSDFHLGGITIGNYTMGPPGFRGTYRDHLFVHEYGHYIQSQRWGPLYLPAIAIPSGISATIDVLSWKVNFIPSVNLHDTRWFEARASRLAMQYFDKNYGSGANGYTPGSPNYFDANSFVNGNSPYSNPNGYAQGKYPITPVFHWTDPLLYSYLLLYPYLMSLISII